MEESFIGFRITGLKPTDLRAGELANLIGAFEDMIASTVKQNRPQISKEDLVVGLVKIEDHSIGLEFTTKLPELALPAYYNITESVAARNFLRLSSDTLKSLRVIHAFAKSQSCECELFSRNGHAILRAVLSPKMEIPDHPKITAQTVMYGRVVRVGGEEPRVMFEASTGKTLFCRVKNEDLARKLGERLYTWVGLGGIAMLDSSSLEILEFRVDGITEYVETHSAQSDFDDLAAVVGKYFSDIEDVESYVAELRD